MGREGPLPMFLPWGTMQGEAGLGAEFGPDSLPLRGVYLVREWAHIPWCVSRSENSLQESVLSFHYVDSMIKFR